MLSSSVNIRGTNVLDVGNKSSYDLILPTVLKELVLPAQENLKIFRWQTYHTQTREYECGNKDQAVLSDPYEFMEVIEYGIQGYLFLLQHHNQVHQFALKKTVPSTTEKDLAQKLVRVMANSWCRYFSRGFKCEFLRRLTSRMDTHVLVEYEVLRSSIIELEGRLLLIEVVLLDMTIPGNSHQKQYRIEDASENAMCAIEVCGFDGLDIAEDEVQANMAPQHSLTHESENSQHPEIKWWYKNLKKDKEHKMPPKIEDWVVRMIGRVDSIPNEEKKANVPISTKKESLKPYNCPNAYKHMVPRAVLMRTGLKTVKNAKPLSTARSVNTVRPVSTARPFYKNTALTKRSNIQNINTAKQVVNTVRPNVNTVRARGFNAVKPSACWSNSQLNEKGFVDSGCSRHMSGNIAHLSDFKEFDGGYVTFGGGANGGRITGKGTIKTDKLDFEDISDCLVAVSEIVKLPDESPIAKATSEESMLWHRRLSMSIQKYQKHLKDNLVRYYLKKVLRMDQTCVAVLKAQQQEPLDITPQSLDELKLQDKMGIMMIAVFRMKFLLLPIQEIPKDHPIDHVIGKTHQDLHTCLFACFLSQEEPKRVSKALSDPAWVEAMQEELLQFKLQNVWFLIDLPNGIGLLEPNGIDAKRIFLAYLLIWSFNCLSNDVKFAFLYVKLKRRCMYVNLQIYVDDIIFGSTKKELCEEFEKLMKDKFQMSSMGELTFFLGLQVQQKKKGIFISQDKYVHEILKKSMIGFLMFHTASRPQSCFAVDFLAMQETKLCFPLLQLKLNRAAANAVDKSAEIVTDDDGSVKIHATIDGHSLSISEGSLRRHLKLDDQDGITSLPTTEIFAQLALMGYATDSDKLTFQKGAFSPQWRFLIHNILHCLSPKKTAWEQFSSNIAAAVICLATNRKFNFSRMIFDHMVSNISSPHKFLMYPRFVQLCLDMQRHKLQQHTRVYSVPSLTMKVFSNMKRITKGFSGQEVALFPNMLAVPTPSASPSNSISSPEPTPTQPSPQPSPTQPSPTQPSPTQPGSEYHPPTPHDSPLHAVHSHGSDEGSLKLQELMNLINTLSDRVGVLEADLTKTKKTYSSAYTKLILRVKKLEAQLKVGKARRHSRFVLSDTEIGEDDSSKQGRKFSTEGVQDDEGVHEKASNDTELFVQEVTPTELIQDQEGSGKASDEVSTAGLKKSTAREEVPTVSTAEATLSTAGGTVTYSRRSAEKRSRKDKGKAILIEEEPKKKSKKDLEQEQLSYAEAIRLEEQMQEEQRAQIARDAEIARQWDEEERKRAMDEAESTKKIDWNDPSVLRYHSLKMKPKPIFESFGINQKLLPIDERKKLRSKKSLKRKIGKTVVLTETFMYYQVFRGDGSSKNYKILSEMLEDFDRMDVEQLFRLVKERYSSSAPEGFDLMLWGDLHTLFEPDKDDEIWKDQHEYNLLR
ncbi:ribonuclease H-like domain-containing protein [Tanacetum coccineum]|uniref:Ribonuclease H-like domain-containing protein n=1 Tax=Tanacetum coccineum TaxID=301880 RepID=A0ABQ5IC48_9ASTR